MSATIGDGDYCPEDDDFGEDDYCEHCEDTGHKDGCESREPAWDIGDLICRYPCDGCCLNGCKPEGMQREQDEAAAKARRLFGR